MKRIHFLMPVALTLTSMPLITMSSCKEGSNDTTCRLRINEHPNIRVDHTEFELGQKLVLTFHVDIGFVIDKEQSRITVGNRLHKVIDLTNDFTSVTLNPELVKSRTITVDFYSKADEETGLCFTAANGQSSSVGYTKTGELPGLNVECKIDDGGWNSWDGNPVNIDGEHRLYVKNKSAFLSLSTDNYFTFTMTGSINASGNVNSMIQEQAINDYCFYSLFDNCSSLITAPTLPDEQLADGCYQAMFSDCTGLTTTPDLPAEELATSCYEGMFSGCSNLTTITELSSTTIADKCYKDMFNGCSSLQTAPTLPATSLKKYCYQSMFANCSNLVYVPDLSGSRSWSDGCYNQMFSGCTSLIKAPRLPDMTLGQAPLSLVKMFYNCSSLKVRQEEQTHSVGNEEQLIISFGNYVPADYVKDMFTGTIGDFQGGTPTNSHDYYWYTE